MGNTCGCVDTAEKDGEVNVENNKNEEVSGFWYSFAVLFLHFSVLSCMLYFHFCAVLEFHLLISLSISLMYSFISILTFFFCKFQVTSRTSLKSRKMARGGGDLASKTSKLPR